MNRKWYKKTDSGHVEAPQSVETEKGTLYNYNCASNEKQLRADGYLPENEIPDLKVVDQTESEDDILEILNANNLLN